jgi:hypothetical protein
MKRNQILAFLLTAMLVSCSGGGSDSSDQGSDEKSVMEEPSEGQKKPEISSREINTLLQSIPSPLEITVLLKKIGVSYNPDLLNDPSNADQYISSYRKAVNLGVYGTDLGYINIYNNQQQVLDYLDIVVQLANDLDVGQFFNFSTMKRLATNTANTDSLLYITTSGFDQMSQYLGERDRSRISVAIITGGWVEGLYLLSKVAETNPSEALDEKIGEQKVVLDNLIQLSGLYESDDKFKTLHQGLKDLKKAYSGVTIEYSQSEAGGSTTEEGDDMLVVEGAQKSEVNITADQVNQISTTVEQLRKKLVKP